MKEFEKQIAVLRILPVEVIVNEYRLGAIPLSLAISSILVKYGAEESISEESLVKLNKVVKDTTIIGEELYLAIKHLV